MGKTFIISVVFSVLLLIPSSFGLASEEKQETIGFTELVATTSERHLLLFGMITNAFTEEMTSGLKSGIPVDFSFFIELNQKNTKEAELLTSLHFRHILTYDTLKDNYKVEFEEFNNKVVSFQDLEEAQRSMCEINGVKVIELSQLSQNDEYQLRIRADLFKKTLPMSLHHIVPFLSWWDRETEWQILEFKY